MTTSTPVSLLRRAVEQAITDPNLALHKFVAADGFWAMLCKGGIENTLRDVMLQDIATHADVSSQSGLFVTGERSVAAQAPSDPEKRRSGPRVDIGIFDKSEVERGSSWHAAYRHSVELKFNFCGQPENELGSIGRSIKGQREALRAGSPCPDGVVCLASIEKASPIYEQVLKRYVRRAKFGAQKPYELRKRLCDHKDNRSLSDALVNPLLCLRVNAGNHDSGHLHFFVTWKPKTPFASSE